MFGIFIKGKPLWLANICPGSAIAHHAALSDSGS